MGQTAHRRSYLLAHMCFLTVNVSAYQSNHGKDKNSKYMFSVAIQIDYPGTTIETSYIYFFLVKQYHVMIYCMSL